MGIEKEYVVTEKQFDDLGLFVKDFNKYQHELFNVGMWAGDWGDRERGFSLGGIYRELERSCDKMGSMLDEIECGYNQISISTSTYTITQNELEELTYFAVEFKVIAEDIDHIPIDEGNSMRIGYELGYIYSNLLHNFTSLLILINNIKKNNKERKGETGGIYLKDKGGYEVGENTDWQIYLRRSDVEKW